MSRTTTPLKLSADEKTQLLRVFPHGIVAVDLETTGLSPLVDRIIEIAAVKITARGDEEVFHQLINPLVDITPENAAIHGLTNELLKDSPTLKRPLRAFWDFVGRTPLLAHNALFDMAFLMKGSHDFMLEPPTARAYDSCRWGRALFKKDPTTAAPALVPGGPANFRLSSLAEFFGIPLQHHIAMEDAFACLKIMGGLIGRTPPEKHEDFKLRAFTISLTQYKKDAAFVMPTRFEEMRPLIRLQSPLDIQYTGGTQGAEWRPVRPIALIPMPKGPVLYAECLTSKMNKSFVLKRIQAFRHRVVEAPLPTETPHVEMDLIESE